MERTPILVQIELDMQWETYVQSLMHAAEIVFSKHRSGKSYVGIVDITYVSKKNNNWLLLLLLFT